MSYLAAALGMISYADLFEEEKDFVVWLLPFLSICGKPRSSSLHLTVEGASCESASEAARFIYDEGASDPARQRARERSRQRGSESPARLQRGFERAFERGPY